MNYVSVEHYVLVTNGYFNKYIFIVLLFLFFCMVISINEINSKIASYFLLTFFIILSLFFSLNGPDKGSYATFYSYLQSYSDIFITRNTIDSPFYYILMVSLKSIGANAEAFFIFQNILISISLFLLSLRIKNGIYVVFWLWFTHLLIPFSVRGHLLLVLLPLLYYYNNRIGKGLVSLASLTLHPLIAVFPLAYYYRNKISLIKTTILISCVIFIFFDYFFGKFSSYISDGKSYYNDTGAFYTSSVFEFIEFAIFYNALKTASIKLSFITKLFLVLPILVSLFSILVPTLGRFVFAFDLMYVLVLLNYNLKISKSMWLLLCLMAFVRFAKNYIMQEYYII
ncbi:MULTISPECIES: EpsG family protein [Yersinia]|uniref:EpsG family protein n=1 Tax=Yersinia TaxID=629 RepID=UPI0005DE531E|nr:MULTISPECIES: EpsG family protein [Yersinia]ARB86059.1 hypothetical protein A6J67_20260 [Yersinia sp. FDAARGOS_228]AVL35908.1 hypothetical protein CEQ36_09940 [Yersinia intermedia]CND67081.1 Uncharacterised protein [Yersinia intermedia]